MRAMQILKRSILQLYIFSSPCAGRFFSSVLEFAKASNLNDAFFRLYSSTPSCRRIALTCGLVSKLESMAGRQLTKQSHLMWLLSGLLAKLKQSLSEGSDMSALAVATSALASLLVSQAESRL